MTCSSNQRQLLTRHAPFWHLHHPEKVLNETESVEVRVRSDLQEIPRLYGQSLRNRGQPRKHTSPYRHAVSQQDEGSSEFNRENGSPQQVYLESHRQMSSLL